jgi:hypothetical protein
MIPGAIAMVSTDVATKIVFFGIGALFAALFILIAKASEWP